MVRRAGGLHRDGPGALGDAKRARAIENLWSRQRSGMAASGQTYGHSLIVDHWARRLPQAARAVAPRSTAAWLDPPQLPALQHRVCRNR
jgi:hypothetical protein